MSDTKELRGDAPTDLVRALDALALSEDLSRTAYINLVLGEHVTKVLHKTSMLHSMLKGNPLMPDVNRKVSE